MTEDTNHITADNLRADFLNATTNWQRWKVLNRALDWAVTASELADGYREDVCEWKARAAQGAAHIEGVTGAREGSDSAGVVALLRGAPGYDLPDATTHAEGTAICVGDEVVLEVGDVAVLEFSDADTWVVVDIRQNGLVTLVPQEGYNGTTVTAPHDYVYRIADTTDEDEGAEWVDPDGDPMREAEFATALDWKTL